MTADSHDTDDLSPEADQWLDEAGQEFNLKQEVLNREWLGQFNRWEFNPDTGRLTLFQPDGGQSVATAEILGSFSYEDAAWEWAWNNPSMPARFSQKSLLSKAVGELLGLEYLTHGVVPIPRDEEGYISYLCSIGLKAAAADGIFRGGNDRVPVYFLVFEPTRVAR